MALTVAQLMDALGYSPQPAAGEETDRSRRELAEATRLLAVAGEVVERYGADAPTDVENEAVIRTAGYLKDRRPGVRRSAETIGSYSHSTAYESGLSAFRLSGAMALLSDWKTRRAGVI